MEAAQQSLREAILKARLEAQAEEEEELAQEQNETTLPLEPGTSSLDERKLLLSLLRADSAEAMVASANRIRQHAKVSDDVGPQTAYNAIKVPFLSLV